MSDTVATTPMEETWETPLTDVTLNVFAYGQLFLAASLASVGSIIYNWKIYPIETDKSAWPTRMEGA